MKEPYIIGGITVLEPDKGKYLTNGEIFSSLVFIGRNDKIENWSETDEKPEAEE